jgi:hypothetical protein
MNPKTMPLVLGWLLIQSNVTAAAQGQTSTGYGASPSPNTYFLGYESVYEVVLTLDAVAYSSYNALLQQAIQSTREAIEAAFTDHPNVSEVRIQLLATNNGSVVPVMTTQVSRSGWQSRPEVEHWAQTTGLSASRLLGLDPSVREPASPGMAAANNPGEVVEPTTRGRGGKIRQILSDDNQ